MVSAVEKAYVAGLSDGEAGLYIQKAITPSKGTWLQPIIDISNNNEECLGYVQELYGGILTGLKLGRGHHLRFYTPLAIQRILQDISPYLIIKKEHAKIMLSFCESRLRRKHHAYTTNEMAWYESLKILNST